MMKTQFRRFEVAIGYDFNSERFTTAAARADVLTQFDVWREVENVVILGVKWAAKGDFHVIDPTEGQHRWELEVLYEVPE